MNKKNKFTKTDFGVIFIPKKHLNTPGIYSAL